MYECGAYTFEWGDSKIDPLFNPAPVFGEVWFRHSDDTGTLLAKAPAFNWMEIVVFEEDAL